MDPSEVPEELGKRLSSSISEAKVLLGVMHSLKGSNGLSKEAETSVGAQLYKVSASKFKRVAAELTHRFDTMSSFLDDSVLEKFASSHGCRWEPSSRKFIVVR
jgi:hypothetical protein